MRINHAILTLIAVICSLLLSGCGLVMGKKVDFGSDYQNIQDERMKELAGKTFFITNEEDHEQLIALKSELRTLLNSGTPSSVTTLSKIRSIDQITQHYYNGVLGAIYPSRWLHKDGEAWLILIICSFFAFSLLAEKYKKWFK